MNLFKLGSSLSIIVVFILAACSQLPNPTDLVLESQATELQKLNSSDASMFGHDVAVDGDMMVVGAVSTDTARGATYLYQKDGTGSWQFVKKLLASDGAEGDYFGYSVAISGTTVVVGALEDDVDRESQGSAYVFERDQGGPNNWGEVKKLLANDARKYDQFGSSVAISGNTVVVGAYYNRVYYNNSISQGSAYLFKRDVGGTNNWGQFRRLLPSDRALGVDGDLFGWSVAISGTTVVVGAYGDDFDTDPNHNQGSAYVFEQNQGGINRWGEVKKLVASDGAGGDNFGWSVAISDTTIVVGSYRNDFDTNPHQNQGSAYIFEQDQGGANQWGEVKKLFANDGAAGDGFGYSVAIKNSTVVVGVPFDDSASNPDQNRGSAYLFRRDAGGTNMWGQTKKLLASGGAKNNNLGFSVAISGSTVVVGSPFGDNNSEGSAYIY
jgi:hypothetical protein